MGFKANFQEPLRLFHTILTVIVGVSFLVAALVVFSGKQDPLSVYFRDPAATYGFNPLAGLISHIGVFLLSATGVVSMFASLHTRIDKPLFLWIGLFSLMIAVDDFFMLHEVMVPRLMGIPEIYVLAFYAAFAALFFFGFRRSLIGRKQLGLYVGVGLLASSILVDLVMDYSEYQVVMEDSLKFLGLVVWSAYWLRRAHYSVMMAKSNDNVGLHPMKISDRAVDSSESRIAQAIARQSS